MFLIKLLRDILRNKVHEICCRFNLVLFDILATMHLFSIQTDFKFLLPTTVGSRSTNTALGICLPALVSLKKVLKESSSTPMLLSPGICPSGWIPCSKQYSSQQALPIWTPACPTWMEIHSRWKKVTKDVDCHLCNYDMVFRKHSERRQYHQPVHFQRIL